MILNCIFEWLDLKTFLFLLILAAILADIIKNKNPPGFPPGPWPLPVLGNVFTGADFKTIDKLAEEYGSVYSLRWGNEKAVFVSGYEMVKEALISQLDNFVDRPIVPLFHKTFKGLGMALSNGHLWRMQRKFANFHLRYFGEGMQSHERNIQQEALFLCEAFKEEQGPFDPLVLLNTAVANIVSALTFGKRYDYSDNRFRRILLLDNEAIVLMGTMEAQLYNMWPWLLNYCPGSHQKVFANYAEITDFLTEEVKMHQEDWDPYNPRDFIDSFLTEMKKLDQLDTLYVPLSTYSITCVQRESDPAAGFNLECLVVCCLDMFEAGTETVATTLRWILLFLIKYPDIQGKVQAEIDRVIGQSRQPTLQDRLQMPYTEAVIHESQRMGNTVPLGFPKMATRDTMLGGYFIPKGTAVTTNLSSVLKDKNQWETPDVFNPEHFLDSEGKFCKNNAFLPFSAGKRACLGEQLARMELFLFLTTLLQRFTFASVPGAELSLEGVLGFTCAPRAYLLKVVPR